MQRRGPTGVVADPLPSTTSTDPVTNAPLGYTPSQLFLSWNFGSPVGPLGADELSAWTTGASVYFVTLVICQLGHLLSMRRKDSPYFSDITGATRLEWVRNAAFSVRVMPTIIFAWAAAIVTTVVITEVPGLQALCNTAHVPGEYWGYAVIWSVALFVLAEARKWVIFYRPKGFVAWFTGF